MRRIVGLALIIMTAATVASGATYYWTGNGGAWTSPISWSPERFTPAAGDTLLFTADSAMYPIASGVPKETVARIEVAALTITFDPGVTNDTLTITGQLVVNAGAGLTFGAATNYPLTLALPSGATASVSGALTTATSFAHRLDAQDKFAITFHGGSVVTQNSTGNLFGSTGTDSVAVFEAGSLFIFLQGANPFGLAAGDSKVWWQPGSVYSHRSATLPAASGRTYADFELNWSALVSPTGTNPMTVDNLVVTLGHLNFLCPVTICGDVVAADSLSFAPTAARTVTFAGSAQQSFSGGGSCSFGDSATLVINNPAGLSLQRDLTLGGGLTLTSGQLVTNGYRLALTSGRPIQRGGGYVNGARSLAIPSGASSTTFPLGTASGYSPLVLSFAGVTVPGAVTVNALQGIHPTAHVPDNCLQRYWQVSADTALAFGSCDATLAYLPADFNVGFTEAADEPTMVVGRYRYGWSFPAVSGRAMGGAADGGTITVTGLTTLSDLTLAKDQPSLSFARLWQTARSGPWRADSTWYYSDDGGGSWWPNVGSYPTAADSDIAITNGYTVTVGAGDSVTVDQLQVSGELFVNGGRLTINDGPGTDLDVYNGGLLRDSTGTIDGGGSIAIENASTYEHSGDGGVIPQASWDPYSYLLIDGLVSQPLTGGLGQAFPQVEWYCSNQAVDMTLATDPAFTCRSLDIEGTGDTTRLILTSAAKPRLDIPGYLYLGGGTAVLGSGGIRTVSVGDYFEVVYPGAWLQLRDSLNPGIDTLYLAGGFWHYNNDKNAGRPHVPKASPQAARRAAALAGRGGPGRNRPLEISGGGPDSTWIAFVGGNVQNYFDNVLWFDGYVSILVDSGATIDAGYSSIGQGSAGDFVLRPRATLRTADGNGLYPSGQDSGAVRCTGLRSFSPGARYAFDYSGSPSYTGPGLPDTVAALIASNYYGVFLSKGVAVTDTLYLDNGDFTIGPNRLELDGAVEFSAYSTNLNGGPASDIKIGGSGGSIVLPTVDAHDLIVDRPGGVLGFNAPGGKGRSGKGGQTVDIYDTLLLAGGTIESVGGEAQIYYEPGSALVYRGSAPLQTGLEAAGAVPVVVVDNPTRVTMRSSLEVDSLLDLRRGVLYTDVNSLTLPQPAVVTRGSGWVAGTMAKYFSMPKEGHPKGFTDRWYEVGDTLTYLPVYVNFHNMNSGWAALTTHDAVYPSAVAPDSCLRRYWTLESTFDFDTCAFRLSYDHRDFGPAFSEAAHESSMVAARYLGAGMWTAAARDSADTAANVAYVSAAGRYIGGMGKATLTFARSVNCLSNQSAISWQTVGDVNADWTDPDIWLFNDGTGWQMADSGFYPDYTSDSILVNANLTVSHDLTLDQVRVINSINHTAGQLTINDRPGGDDLVFDEGGQLYRHAGGTFIQNGTIVFGPYCAYYHHIDGGDIPQATWDSTSTVTIDSVVAATAFASGSGQHFGDVVFNDALLAGNFTLASEPGFSAHNLDVYATGAAGTLTLSGPACPQIAIPGFYNEIDSCRVRIGQAGHHRFDVGRAFENTGSFSVNDPAWPGCDTLTIGGDYDNYRDLYGGGPDSALVLFGPGTHFAVTQNTEQVFGHVNYEVAAGAALAIFQDHRLGVGDQGRFTLSAGAALTVNDPDGIAPSGVDSGAVRVGGTRSFSPQADYTFQAWGTTPMDMSTGRGLPDSVRQLTFDLTMVASGHLAKDVIVKDTLDINNAAVNLDGHTLTIDGAMAGFGGAALTGTPASGLVIRGTGPRAQIPSDGIDELSLGTFTLDRPSGAQTTSDTRVAGTVNLTSGVLTLGAGSPVGPATRGHKGPTASLIVDSAAVVNRGSGWVNGPMARFIATPFASYAYDLGDSASYAPLTLSFGDVFTPGYLTASEGLGVAAHVDSTDDVLRRYWATGAVTAGFDSCAATFSYCHGDFNPPSFNESPDENTMVVGRYDNASSQWGFPSVALRTPGGAADGGSIKVSGLYAFQVQDAAFTTGHDQMTFGNAQSDTIWRTRGMAVAHLWRSDSAWEWTTAGSSYYPASAGRYPDYHYGSITVQSGDTVIVDSSITLDQVAVDGVLLQAGGTITVNNGSGDDLLINNRMLRLGGTTAGGGVIHFGPAAEYDHLQNGGQLPVARWDSSAQVVVSGITTARSFAAGINQPFPMLRWDCLAQLDTFVLATDTAFTAGGLEVQNTGAGVLQLAGPASPRVAVRGDLTVARGKLLLGSGVPSTVSVTGNLSVQHPAWLYLNDLAHPAIDTLKLAGNYSHSQSGIRGGGADSTAIVFNGQAYHERDGGKIFMPQAYNAQMESLPGHVDYLVAPGAALDVQSYSPVGRGSLGHFVLSDSATLIVNDTAGIRANAAKGAVQVAGARSYSKRAAYF
ncbi:MAG TPA: hypothetical protein VMF29_09625, partial [Candidatus Edwardsbacteria bacterium]|nr:hypothetical protein [Candidatus Edwardsbacteria bacterium]